MIVLHKLCIKSVTTQDAYPQYAGVQLCNTSLRLKGNIFVAVYIMHVCICILKTF